MGGGGGGGQYGDQLLTSSYSKMEKCCAVRGIYYRGPPMGVPYVACLF